MIKRIIFDIDGTLINSIDFYPVILQALRNYGVDSPNKAQLFLENIKSYEEKYSTYDKKLYLDFFSKKLGINLDNNFLIYFFNELKKAVPQNTRNIYEILSNLSGYELVLLSNYFEESQRNRLEAMGINHFFTEYYGELKTKPCEEAYLSAAGVHKPNECVIIGDNKKLDIDIPQTLGFNTIYVNENGNIRSINNLSLSLIKKFDN